MLYGMVSTIFVAPPSCCFCVGLALLLLLAGGVAGVCVAGVAALAAAVGLSRATRCRIIDVRFQPRHRSGTLARAYMWCTYVV